MRAEAEGIARLQAVHDPVEVQVDLAAQHVAGLFAFMGDGFAAFAADIDVVDRALQQVTALGDDAFERDAGTVARPVVERHHGPLAGAEDRRVFRFGFVEEPADVGLQHPHQPMDQRQRRQRLSILGFGEQALRATAALSGRRPRCWKTGGRTLDQFDRDREVQCALG